MKNIFDKKSLASLFCLVIFVLSYAVWIYAFWRNDYLITSIGLIYVLVFYLLFKPKYFWPSVIIGSTIVQVMELGVNSNGAWTYATQTLLTSPLYLIPSYIIGILASREFAQRFIIIFRLKDQEVKISRGKETIVSFSLMIFYIILLRYFWQDEIIVLIITSIVAILHQAWLKNRQSLIIFILAAVFGGPIDAIGTYFGAWSWGRPTLFGISLWTPIMYGNCFTLLNRFVILLSSYLKIEPSERNGGT